MDYEFDDPRCDLDDYFILRLPEREAAYLRKLLRKKPKKVAKRCSLKLDEQFKAGILKIKKRTYSGRMVHLPTVIDVNKSMNGTTMYKTGTLSQMFVIDSDKTLDKIKHDNWPHGVSRPLKNIRRQRFRKTLRNNEEESDIQEEITWLLRDDYESLSSYYEVYYEKVYKAEEVDEDALFGSMSDCSSDSNHSEESSGSGEHYDIMEFN